MERPMTFTNGSGYPRTRFDVADYTYLGYTGHADYYTPVGKQAQAQYEDLYGHPADIDAVWAARDAIQNK